MFLQAEQSSLRGTVAIPGSKSHTIRAITLASLAEGESFIRQPLHSLDTMAAVDAFRAFGARIDTTDPYCWRVKGFAGRPHVPEQVIDVANSGTTMYVIFATAALCADGWTVITGDEQIRRRPADKLISALTDLGADIFSTRGGGLCPLVIRGPFKGGSTTIEAITSQWVTAILLNAPFAEGDTELHVTKLNEAPYVQITLDWLNRLNMNVVHNESLSHLRIPGRQAITAFDRAVAADFSSATFFLVAGAALDADIEITGLDMADPQGDKAVIEYLRAMGAQIEIDPQTSIIRTKQSELHGADLDLNATPDALPAMAVAAALTHGTTRLLNVPQARVKETDRIAVMAAELTKMGVNVRELSDGLIIEGKGKVEASQNLQGHADHRVVMALSLAAMAAKSPSRIDTAEAVAVTFPTYVELMQSLGARMQVMVQ